MSIPECVAEWIREFGYRAVLGEPNTMDSSWVALTVFDGDLNLIISIHDDVVFGDTGYMSPYTWRVDLRDPGSYDALRVELVRRFDLMRLNGVWP